MELTRKDYEAFLEMTADELLEHITYTRNGHPEFVLENGAKIHLDRIYYGNRAGNYHSYNDAMVDAYTWWYEKHPEDFTKYWSELEDKELFNDCLEHCIGNYPEQYTCPISKKDIDTFKHRLHDIYWQNDNEFDRYFLGEIDKEEIEEAIEEALIEAGKDYEEEEEGLIHGASELD